jgi:hypothetical protein
MNVDPADSEYNADVKSGGTGFPDTPCADLKGTGASDGIIGGCGGPVETETEVIDISRFDFGQDVVKQVSVGVNRDRIVSKLSGGLDNTSQFPVERGFAAEENEVGFTCSAAEQFQPAFSDIQGEGFFAVLVGVDIAVAAIQIAAGCDVKKDVGSVPRKGDGFFHFSVS